MCFHTLPCYCFRLSNYAFFIIIPNYLLCKFSIFVNLFGIDYWGYTLLVSFWEVFFMVVGCRWCSLNQYVLTWSFQDPAVYLSPYPSWYPWRDMNFLAQKRQKTQKETGGTETKASETLPHFKVFRQFPQNKPILDSATLSKPRLSKYILSSVSNPISFFVLKFDSTNL